MSKRNRLRGFARNLAFAGAFLSAYSGNGYSGRGVSADESDGSPRNAPYAQLSLDRTFALPGDEVTLTVYTDLSQAVGPVAAFEYRGQVPSWMETTASPNDINLFTSEPQSPDLGTYVDGIFSGQTVNSGVHFLSQNRFVTGMVTVPPQYPPGVISPVGDVGQVKFRVAPNTPRGSYLVSFAAGGARYTACTNVENGDYVLEFIPDKRGTSLYVKSPLGDVDGNGFVEMADTPHFVDVLTGNNSDPEFTAASDMNSDGYVDGNDIQSFLDSLNLQ